MKRQYNGYDNTSAPNYPQKKRSPEKNDFKQPDEKVIKAVAYYEKTLRCFKEEIEQETKEIFISNALNQSMGIEVDLSCHFMSCHCLELLLTECKDFGVIQRFMCAFAKDRYTVFTNACASYITEILIHHTVKRIQNWFEILNSEDSEEKDTSFCINWLSEFGEFALENLNDCLSNPCSCHVLCTFIRAFAGDLSKAIDFKSRNTKIHKQEFFSQYIEKKETPESEEDSVVLEQIPKIFRKILKNLLKSIIKSENFQYYVTDSASATVIETLLNALRKRCSKSFKKYICKMAEVLFSKKNENGVPFSLLHKNCSYVVDQVFKLAEPDLQLELWNNYIVDHLGTLVTHLVGNFILQRIFDVITEKSVFVAVCEGTWKFFDAIMKSQNFGIFVSIANACNRLSAEQAPFMKNIMQSLHCYEPEERQGLLIPLLLKFQDYESYVASESEKRCENLSIQLQGSLVVQAVLKFHKPIKAVQSMLITSPTYIEFLSGHIQGCHVLNTYFKSVSVGEKNKEKLLKHLKPVIVSIACDRHKSLTLSRIWMLLSLKLKEILARELAENVDTLSSNSNGYAILKKFSIHHFKNPDKWKEIQANISLKKFDRK